MNFDELSEPNRNLSRVARLMHVTNAFIFKKTYILSMSLLSIRFLMNARRDTRYNRASPFHLLSQLIPENPAKQEHVYEL